MSKGNELNYKSINKAFVLFTVLALLLAIFVNFFAALGNVSILNLLVSIIYIGVWIGVLVYTIRHDQDKMFKYYNTFWLINCIISVLSLVFQIDFQMAILKFLSNIVFYIWTFIQIIPLLGFTYFDSLLNMEIGSKFTIILPFIMLLLGVFMKSSEKDKSARVEERL